MNLKTQSKLYRAALYARLSREDEKEGESSSISTQLKMLNSYAYENKYIVHDEYIDDGFSGTNFDRPGFIRMVKDIEAGYINLVITKDLSRLGRDYIKTGQYTEIYFPEHNVRYIAINDGYDSESQHNDMAPFKHVINDMYARDISKKIRSAFKIRIQEGLFIGNFAPYGYKKSPENKNKLIIDPTSSIIVKEMFEKAKNGHKPSEIAKIFNNRGIITPAMYRCENYEGLNIDTYSKRKEWTSSIICKMLRNIVYLGHTAQGKTTKVSYKSKVTLANDRDDWIVIKNTHNAIVDNETFEKVRNRCVSRKNEPKNGFKNVFSGIAKCMDCGKNMSTTGTRKKGAIANLVCGGYKLYGSKECSNHFIDYEILYNIVISELKRLLNLSEEEKFEISSFLFKENKSESDSQNKLKTLNELEKRTRELDKITKKLYEDNISGKLSDERFSRMLQTYEKEQTNIDEKKLIIKSLPSDASQNNLKDFLNLLNEISEINELTPQLLQHLIEKIEVGQGVYNNNEKNQKKKQQNVKIYYRFVGELF